MMIRLIKWNEWIETGCVTWHDDCFGREEGPIAVLPVIGQRG